MSSRAAQAGDQRGAHWRLTAPALNAGHRQPPRAAGAGSAAGSTLGEAFLVPLTADVYAVGCLLAMDGRVPWLAEDLRGFEPCWVYVLLSGEDRALLVDTGLPVHRESLLRRLAALVGERRVSVLFTRCNEPDCVLNLGAIMDRFPVERVYGFAQNAASIRSGRARGSHSSDRRTCASNAAASAASTAPSSTRGSPAPRRCRCPKASDVNRTRLSRS